jgi:hypothetical protein
MDGVLIVGGFGALFSKRIRALITGQFVSNAGKGDVRELAETVRAVAHDKDGEMRVESIRYQDGVWTRKLEIEFDTRQARKAVATLDAQKADMDKKSDADHERVLMIFTRSDVNNAEIGKRSGERVKVEELSEKPLALMYGPRSPRIGLSMKSVKPMRTCTKRASLST